MFVTGAKETRSKVLTFLVVKYNPTAHYRAVPDDLTMNRMNCSSLQTLHNKLFLIPNAQSINEWAQPRCSVGKAND